MSNTETPFTAAVERALCAPERSTRVQRVNSGSAIVMGRDGSTRVFRGAKTGTGDLGGYVGPEGWHIEVECKVDGAKQSLAQRRRQVALERAGCIYVVVRFSSIKGMAESVDRAVAEVDAAIHARRHGDNWHARPEGGC